MESKEILLLLIAMCGVAIDCSSTKRLQQKYTIKFDALSKDFCLQNHTANCYDRCASVGYTDEWFCDVTGSDSFCNCKLFDPATALADSTWHMIIGGLDTTQRLQSVELYNWKTQKQCFIEPLPKALSGHSGAIINGDPVVCGGEGVNDVVKPGNKIQNSNSNGVECFRYQKDAKNWTQISDLLWRSYNAASVNIPSQGWLLFSDIQSQKLANLNSSWESGPAYPPGLTIFSCAVQLNESVTALIGIIDFNFGIFTYDWSSPQPTFVRQTETLQVERFYSACDLFVSKTGDPVVAIAGGNSPYAGMEVWNPRTKTVETVFDATTQDGPFPNYSSQLLAIKGGSELILYGGFGDFALGNTGKALDYVWKYVVSNNTWTKIGNLLAQRQHHVALKVSGIECPN